MHQGRNHFLSQLPPKIISWVKIAECIFAGFVCAIARTAEADIGKVSEGSSRVTLEIPDWLEAQVSRSSSSSTTEVKIVGTVAYRVSYFPSLPVKRNRKSGITTTQHNEPGRVAGAEVGMVPTSGIILVEPI